MSMKKCVNCPIVDPDRVCPAIALGHPRYCELIDPEDCDFDPRYAAILVREATPVDRSPGEGVRAGLSTTGAMIRERLALVHACDYRGAKTGCGCDDRRLCGLCRGSNVSDRREATIADCLRCVSARDGDDAIATEDF